MKSNNQQSEPKLDRPGAGVPLMLRLVMRYYLGPFKAGKADWRESREQGDRIHAKILQAVEGLTEAQLSKKVLVPPQPGLEDSSRYWSIAMALEHLLITHPLMSHAIVELTNGRLPDGKADTAAVKPLGTMAPKDAVAQFRGLAARIFVELETKIGDRHSPLTFDHPWFGPFKARQWYWLIGQHAGLHYQQIKKIKAGL
ncbi:MAG: DinB family protein [Deltaproteobacteria bacterium]|nr:DinB family protein [Deltaproteobacteria bacterium]